ncbi:type IV secretory system conjugative DNA transfer family protein [Flagellimonas pacifica]|uniref:Type IV secretory pathway, VirD4 component, TraG/TraD family ATPase n=1 Tax=Flagellimonas pacifica TaxID=1247520 RepID=A0A285MW52_9FLAO|nr:type IV secretory system conjugative DNA transfer family protein [Allomuricauda parva]SNZ01429.1 Type IV secretory pathway, VirD4 component, TraG/TraD family ATPase [Allomuricauda parva]
MHHQKMVFPAMLLSVACFAAIGFLDFYPLFRYYRWDGTLLELVHGFLLKFAPLKEPFKNKLYLLLVVVGAVMLYNPIKIEGKSLFRGFVLFVLGCSLLALSDVVKAPHVPLYWLGALLYFLGFVFLVMGAIHLFQVMSYSNLAKEDPFNEQNETFLQTEERIDTPYSVNIPYDYRYRGKIRKGWINFVNLFRALLIIGTPGSGKSFALIEEIIEQLIDKFFTLLIYDFKFDTLSKIAYNYWLRKRERVKKEAPEKLALMPEFYVLSFDNIQNRCNPIDPYLMKNQMDAADAATIIMKNLNREWIKRNDFFSRSAISFVSGMIWYLKKKAEEMGKNICTLPHVIILSTVNIEYLLDIMLRDLEVRNLMIPFKDALEREAGQQLAGQTASAQISLSMLANKEIFYVMTGNDFQLDLNNPQKPKIVCIQNNPDRSEIYAAPIGLYINKILQVVNKPGCRPLGLVLDELPTVFIMGLRKIIDTGRSHLVATILGVQSITQLIADYGKELADVIFDNCSNVFSGAAKGETARRISEIFGRIHQEKRAKTISKNDTTTNFSTQMMELLPKSKVTGMSTGHFGGIVADTFENQIEQKLCYGLLRPNMESKKIQGKHAIPKVRDFKVDDHDVLVGEQLELMERIDIYRAISQLDFSQINYIDFYNVYIPEFAPGQYTDPTARIEFVKLVLDLKLFDHLPKLNELTSEKKGSKAKLQSYLKGLVEDMLIANEMDRVLSDNFIRVLEDIDNLVKDEYYRYTGKFPEFSIFDKQKIGEEIETSLEESHLFLDDSDGYDELSTEQILERYTNSEEKATFEGMPELEDKDLFQFGGQTGERNQFSSYPVEIIEE